MFPVEIFRSALLKLATILDDCRIRFHLTGGLTSAAYGEPRMTQDIDIVIDPQQVAESLDAFVQSLRSSDLLFDESSLRRGVAEGGMFQLLDNVEALKLDIYPREMIAGELARSVQMEVFEGVQLPVVSLVDAAISKLIWISKGSEKSRRDLRAIFRKGTEVQKREIVRIAQEIQLRGLLEQVLQDPEEIE